MARYIDSEQVVREILSLSQTDGIYGRGLKRGIDLSLAIVNRQDTADVVEVCRCEKCKYCEKAKSTNNTYFCCIGSNAIETKLNDFCSYGERRTDNDL